MTSLTEDMMHLVRIGEDLLKSLAFGANQWTNEIPTNPSALFADFGGVCDCPRDLPQRLNCVIPDSWETFSVAGQSDS